MSSSPRDDRDPDDSVVIIDGRTWVCLCDVGAPGFSLAETVDSYGRRKLWFVDDNRLGADDTDHGALTTPQHEGLGPLSQPWAKRVAAAPLRCGRPTAKGRPCRMNVERPGAACALHETHDSKGSR